MPYSRRGSDDDCNYRVITSALAVVIQGRYAGEIGEYEQGFACFEYDPSYVGPCLSARMPMGEGPFNRIREACGMTNLYQKRNRLSDTRIGEYTLGKNTFLKYTPLSDGDQVPCKHLVERCTITD